MEIGVIDEEMLYENTFFRLPSHEMDGIAGQTVKYG